MARAAVEDMGLWLGRGLSLVQDVLDPELIVIGGGVSACLLYTSDAADE